MILTNGDIEAIDDTVCTIPDRTLLNQKLKIKKTVIHQNSKQNKCYNKKKDKPLKTVWTKNAIRKRKNSSKKYRIDQK